MLTKGDCPFTRLGCFGSHHNAVNVVVEATAGSTNIYSYSPEQRYFRLQRVVPSAKWYVGDIGFIPKTLGQDSRNLRSIVMAKEATFVGCVVEAIVVGGIVIAESKQTVVVTIPVAQGNCSSPWRLSDEVSLDEDERAAIVRSVIARLDDKIEDIDRIPVHFEWMSLPQTILRIEKARTNYINNKNLEFDDRFEGGGN